MARPGEHKHHLVPRKRRFGTLDQMRVEVLRIWKMDAEERPLSLDAYCVGCQSETRFNRISERSGLPRYACREKHVLYGKDLNWKRVCRVTNE